MVAAIAVADVDEAAVGRLIAAGANLVRLELGDASRGDIEAAYTAVRAAGHNARNPIGIIAGVRGTPDATLVELLAGLGVDFLALGPEVDLAALGDVRAAIPTGSSLRTLVRVEPDGPDGSDGPGSSDGPEARIAASDGLIVAARGSARALVALAHRHQRPVIASTDANVAWTAVSLRLFDGGADAIEVNAGDSMDALVDGVTALVATAADLDRDTTAVGEERSIDAAVLRAAVQLALDISAAGIVVLPSDATRATAAAISAARPAVPIVALAPSIPIMLSMSVLWGVIPRFVRPDETAVGDALALAVCGQLDLGTAGDPIITIDGLSPGETPRVAVLTR